MLLSEIKRDERFEGFLIVRSAEQRAAASGKNYLDMTLADRSGSINAKMWDGTVQPPVAGSIVKVRATGNEFNGRMQLRVEKIRAAEKKDEVDMSSLIPCAPRDPKEMLAEVIRAAESRLAERLKNALVRRLGGAVKLYVPQHEGGIVLFSPTETDAETLAARLDGCGICVRAGLHCAPEAHARIGSDGAVRVSFGVHNRAREVDEFVRAVENSMGKA